MDGTTDASNIQQAMMILLESSADANAGGLGMETLNHIQEHLSKACTVFIRNRGSDAKNLRGTDSMLKTYAGLM